LTLTECGRKYYETALKINELWDDLDAELTAYKSRSLQKNVINIGIADDDLLLYVSNCIDTLSETYPDVSFHLYCTSVNELHNKIEDGSLDIAASPYITQNPNFIYLVFRQSEVDMVVSHSNPLSRFSYQIPGQQDLRLSMQNLDPNTPFTLIREPAILRQEENRYLQKMKFFPNIQRTYIVHDTISDILHHSNDLVGFCPRHLRSEKMAYIALDPPFFYKSAVYYRKDKELTPAEKKMISMLKNQPKTRDI